MIVITGAAGFIGSYLIGRLNLAGIDNLVLVDRYDDPLKEQNLRGKKFSRKIDRDEFFDWFDKNRKSVELVFHLGARTDTICKVPEIYNELNLYYSQNLWKACAEADIPLIYASSAATYGNGEHGFSDAHNQIELLKPLNLYARSKHDFDVWALNQEKKPPFWVGLKFFNVYGPNEYHKGRMASVVLHAFDAIRRNGKIELFKSHRPLVKDGDQKRDFIYVDDIIRVMLYFMEERNKSGVYNVGTGHARSFLDLALAVFKSMKIDPVINFVDTPPEIRDHYQYFTEANVKKLCKIGFPNTFLSLEDGVAEYVTQFLISGRHY